MIDDATQYLIDIESTLRIGFIEAFIGYFLSNWIKFANMRQITMDPKLDMDKEAWYINFNFTATLPRIHDIHGDNLLHIHGSNKDDEVNKIVFGSGDNDPLKCKTYFVKAYGKGDDSSKATIKSLVDITK